MVHIKKKGVEELVIQCEFPQWEPDTPSGLPKFSFVTWHASYYQYSLPSGFVFPSPPSLPRFLPFFLTTFSIEDSYVPPKPVSPCINILHYYGTFVTNNEPHHWFLSFRFSEVKSKIASKWGSIYLTVLDR